MQLTNKLLRQSTNQGQTTGAVIGLIAGLTLLLIALQVFVDFTALTTKGKGGEDKYVIINKQVNIFNTIGVSAGFTDQEIEDLKTKEFVKSIGLFSSNKYKVRASSSTIGFYTDLFFESVPDDYLDVSTRNWDWSPKEIELPIILSRDYLALYNFGFAPSQGLPQFTPGTIKNVRMEITIQGKGRRQTFQGRIIGFSDRFNSILVPQSFMNWANDRFGSGEQKPSRLILEVNNPYSKTLADFLDKNNYDVSSRKLIGGQVGTLIRLIIGIIGLIGAIIILLAFLIFLLNFRLIVARSRSQIQLLLQLGYKTVQISGLLSKRLFILFGIALGVTVLLFFAWRLIFVNWLSTQGFELSAFPSWLVVIAFFVFSALFILINQMSIKKNVERLFT